MSSIGPDLYIDVPIETDPQDVLNDAYTYLASAIPGWEPAAGNLDVWILMAISALAAESRDVASLVPSSIFRWFGANLVNVPPVDESSATVLTDWTMVNNNGYTIPAGTQVAIPVVGSDPVPFITLTDAVVPPGTTTITGVEIEAVDPGAAANGLGSIGGSVELLDALNFVSSITQEAVTSGGADAELDSAYLDRLAAELQLLAPRPILPSDFAVYSRNVTGVYRAVAVDGYDPGSNTYNNPREISVAATDNAGVAIAAGVKTALQAYLQAAREVNFIVNVIDPTLNIIDVTVHVKKLAAWDAALVQSSVQDAINGYINPLTWGSSPGTANPQDWQNTTVLRYLELAKVIGDAAGVAYVETLTFGLHGGALSAADLNLTGVAPLVTVTGGTVSITVDA